MSEPDRKDKHPGPEHVHELDVLWAMVRQEDRQADRGWGGSWTKERYQRLKEKHLTAYKTFLARVRVQRAKEQHERQIFERYSYSPYIEQKSRELPEPGESDRYLEKLKRLRYAWCPFSFFPFPTYHPQRRHRAKHPDKEPILKYPRSNGKNVPGTEVLL